MEEALPPISLELQVGYKFEINFGLPEVARLTTDATPPLGHGKGPDSEMLLMAAVGNCLTASLAFALRKFKNPEVPMRAIVGGRVARNDQGRLRMHGMTVEIRLGVPVASLRLAQRALEQYEVFCVVTQSIRAAIPVTVQVFDSDAVLLTPQAS